MSNQLVKGSGCGIREWREDFVLTDTDSSTVLFKVGRTYGDITSAGIPKLSGIETVTAAAGGTQAGALALSTSKPIHNVTVVATAADSVKLPLATGSGAIHFVKNSDSADSCQIFGSGTDTIDGVATATGVAIAAGKARLFVDAASGNWLSLLGA